MTLQSSTPWWKHFPRAQRGQYRGPRKRDRPQLRSGDTVRLRWKPGQVRRLLKVQWHAFRQEYVYILETSAQPPFEPYWFFGQLEVESRGGSL